MSERSHRAETHSKQAVTLNLAAGLSIYLNKLYDCIPRNLVSKIN